MTDIDLENALTLMLATIDQQAGRIEALEAEVSAFREISNVIGSLDHVVKHSDPKAHAIIAGLMAYHKRFREDV
jgi:hypothetical protein